MQIAILTALWVNYIELTVMLLMGGLDMTSTSGIVKYVGIYEIVLKLKW